MYGFVDDNLEKYKQLKLWKIEAHLVDTSVIKSLAKSRAKSWLIKHANPDSATPASYWFWLFKSFLIMFVVSINTCELLMI